MYLYLRDPQKIIFLSLYIRRGYLSYIFNSFYHFFCDCDSSWIMTWHEERIHKQPFLLKPVTNLFLTKHFNFNNSFLQMSLMWALKDSLQSNFISRRFSHLILAIIWFSFFKLTPSLVMEIKWHFFGSAFIWLSRNH